MAGFGPSKRPCRSDSSSPRRCTLRRYRSLPARAETAASTPPETPRSESRYLCHCYHPLVQTLVTSRARDLDARAVACDSPAQLGRLPRGRRRPRAGLCLFLRQRFIRTVNRSCLCECLFGLSVFFSGSVAQIPNDIGFVRSSRHLPSAAAQRLSDSPQPGRCPSFHIHLPQGTERQGPFCRLFCWAHCSSVTPSDFGAAPSCGNCLFAYVSAFAS